VAVGASPFEAGFGEENVGEGSESSSESCVGEVMYAGRVNEEGSGSSGTRGNSSSIVGALIVEGANCESNEEACGTEGDEADPMVMGIDGTGEKSSRGLGVESLTPRGEGL
jgi:hypothetical protein